MAVGNLGTSPVRAKVSITGTPNARAAAVSIAEQQVKNCSGHISS